MADAKIKIRGGAGNAVQIQSRDVDAAAPSDTEVLAWNATDSEWEPTTAGASASFKTISVSGQDDVVADSAADTLTLAEGSNVTITTNASSDTVTIAASGGGSTEWTDTGTVLHPADSSGTLDNVVVGGTTTGNADIILGVDGAAVFNEQGANVDFRVESDAKTHMLFVDGGEDQVGINTSAVVNKSLSVVDSAIIKGKALFTLTGSIDPAASTTVTGSGTAFLTEVSPGDQLVVSGETRTVRSVTNDTTLVVDSPFTDNSNDTSPDCNPAAFTVLKDGGTIAFAVDGDETVQVGTCLKIQTEDDATVNQSARLFFKEEIASDLYGFSQFYTGDANPVFGNTTFTAPANSFNIFRHNNSETGTAVMTMERGTGNIGIGTTAPNAKVDINAGSSDNVEAFAVSEGPTERFRMVADYSPSGNLLHFNGNGNRTLFTFDTDSGSDVVKAGNVGCGISPETADEKFVLDGNFAIKGQSAAPDTAADYAKVYAETQTDANTLLLMHMDGSDSAQVFTDSSSSARTVTVGGNTHTDTTIKKWTSSAQFDGSGDYLELPASSDWDFGTSGDFTIEMWVYFNNFTNHNMLANQWSNAPSHSGDWQMFFRNTESGKMEFFYKDSGGNWAASEKTATAVAATTWTHIAVVRHSGTIKFYFNGVADTTTVTDSAQIGDASKVLRLGRTIQPDHNLDGYVDEFRVSDVARYTSDFTVQSEPFDPITGSGAVARLVLPDETRLSARSSLLGPITAKAWVYFNGTGTVAILSSNNVSSITDIGTGYYKVNYTTALESDDNAPFVMSGHQAQNWAKTMFAGTDGTGTNDAINKSAFAFTLSNPSEANEDCADVCALTFGD